MNSNLEHREPSSQRLWPSTKRTDPSLILEVRMQRSATFVSDKMSKEAARFVLPMRGLIIEWEGDLESMKPHDGVDGHEVL